MELWIRTQSKQSLVKVNNISVNVQDRNRYIIDSNDYILGRYKSYARALEVLDDIEDKLINCTFAKKQNGLGEVLDFMPNSIYVYTMPRE